MNALERRIKELEAQEDPRNKVASFLREEWDALSEEKREEVLRNTEIVVVTTITSVEPPPRTEEDEGP